MPRRRHYCWRSHRHFDQFRAGACFGRVRRTQHEKLALHVCKIREYALELWRLGSVMVTLVYGAKIFKPSQRSIDKFKARRRRFAMKRVMISAIVLVALIGVAFVLRSRPASIELSAATAAMPSLLELHTMAGVSKLPMQEMEDQSLVYPTVEKR